MIPGELIYIKAEVLTQIDKTLTVRLLNGFGNPEQIVHLDAIVQIETVPGL